MNREELLSRQQAGETLTQEELDFLAASPSPQTPPTNQPTDHPTDDAANRQAAYIASLEALAREQNQRIMQLSGTQNSPNPPANNNNNGGGENEEDDREFYNSPKKAVRSIIQEELGKTINPLVQALQGFRFEGSPFDQLLNQFRGDARFSAALADPQVTAAVSAAMRQVELTPNNMQAAIVHVMGLKAMNLLNTVAPPPAAPAAPPQNNNRDTVLPPHMRPTAPPSPVAPRNNNDQTRPLTEAEQRLKREQGFKTDKEFLDWMEMPAREVAHTSYGRQQ